MIAHREGEHKLEDHGHVFGQRLQRCREHRRWSRETLSELCGVSKNMIGRYERGEHIPSIDIAAEIADVLEVSLDYLAGRQKFL